MKTIWTTGCPRCEEKNAVVTGHGIGGVRSHCTNCGHYWPKYQDYVTEYQATGLPGPYPTEISIPLDCVGIDPAYPGSEEMSSDIADLIKTVEKSFLTQLVQDLGKLCYGRPDKDSVHMMWTHLNALMDEMEG